MSGRGIERLKPYHDRSAAASKVEFSTSIQHEVLNTVWAMSTGT